MNFRAKSPGYEMGNHQYYAAGSNGATTAYTLPRSPIKYGEHTNHIRNPESTYRIPVGADVKAKLSFPLSQFPTIPITKDAPAFTHEPKLQSTSSGMEQKLKFREVTDDLAKLKKKLQGIIISNNQNGSLRSETESRNRSAEKLYSPYYRIDDIKAFAKTNNEEEVHKLDFKIRQQKNEPYQARRLATQPNANYYTSRSSLGDSQTSANLYASPSTNYIKNNFYGADSNMKAKSPESTYSYRSNSLEIDQEKVNLQSRIEALSKEKEGLFGEKEKLKQMLETEQNKNKDLEQKYHQVCEEYQECQTREAALKERVLALEREALSNANSKTKVKHNFEQVLKEQLEETQRIKETIEEKNEEIAKLNETITLHRRSTEEAVNDANVQKLKFMTEKRQMEQLHEIALLHKENEVKTLKHALETMQAKLQVAVKENKTKDQFLQQHLVGRLKTGEEKEYVNRILEKYQYEFPSNKLKDKLLEEQKEIEHLKSLLQGQSQSKNQTQN